MAQEDVEMKDVPNTSQSSVVTDFLAALFANHPTKEQEEKGEQANQQDFQQEQEQQLQRVQQQQQQQLQPPPQQLPQSLQQLTQPQHHQPRAELEPRIARGAGVKRDRTPDEFDEYEMLSKRKHGSRATHQENGTTTSTTIASRADDVAAAASVATPSTIDTVTTTIPRRVTTTTSTATIAEEGSNGVDIGGGNRGRNISAASPSRRMGTSPSRNERPYPVQRNRDQVIPEARLLVRGLPHGLKKRDILDYFSKYGPILDAYFKDTSGFIQFGSREACHDAYHSENGNFFRGSQLELNLSGPRRRDTTPNTRRGDDEHRPSPMTSYRANKKFHNENRPVRKFDEFDHDRYRDNDSNRRNKPSYPTSPTASVANPTSSIAAGNNYYRLDNANHQHDHHHHRYNDDCENVSDGDRFESRLSSRRGRNGTGNGGGTMGRVRGGGRFGGSSSSSTTASAFAPIGGANTAGTLNQKAWRNDDIGARPPVRGKDHYQPSPPKHHATHSHAHPVPPPQQQRQPAAVPASKPTSMLLPKRTEKDVPLVQVVAWDNVSSSFTDYIEKSFRLQQITIHTLRLQYGQLSRDEVVSHLIMEGVRALLVVDPAKQALGKIYLQVFEPNGDGSVRFDEYDSISIEEAIAVMQRVMAQQKNPVSYPMAAVSPPRQGPPIQAPQAQPQATQAPVPSPMAMPNIDPNTLSSLITLVKGMMHQQQQQQQQPPQPQPLIQQQQQQAYTPPVNSIPITQQQPQPEQPSYVATPPLPANISPAVLNSPAVQQLLASMNQQQPKPPVVTSTPTSAGTSTNVPAYSVPTSQPSTSATSSYYGAGYGYGYGYGNNYSQQQQQQQQSNGSYARYPEQAYQTTHTNGSASIKNEVDNNKSSGISMNGSATSTTAAATASSSSSASVNAPATNGGNTLGNTSIGDLLDKLQMFTQPPLPQRQ